MSFDPMRGPSAIAQGKAGAVRIGGLTAGVLTTWRVVISPTTGKPTLFGEGRIRRYFTQALGAQVAAELTPAPHPIRIGRPMPPTARPFTLTGRIVEINAGRITIADGDIVRD